MTRSSPVPPTALPPNRVTTFRSSLLRWFRAHARDLPWRKIGDPYRTWVAEILLQQTRVDQGLPYYERFVAAFPDVETLANADPGAVLKLWEGLGYYARARNMLRAAQEIHRRGGVFPTTAEEWRALPGIGRYTAGAIASIAFGERTPLVDGNVARVLSRVFRVEDIIDEPAVAEELWRIAGELVPARSPGDFNEGLMELGATVCLPRTPRCAECPVRRLCEAHEAGIQDSLPRRRPKKPIPHHDLLVAVVRRRDTVLLCKRPQEGFLGGLWEYPNCPAEDSIEPSLALEAYMQRVFGIRARPERLLGVVNHAYSHFRVTLHVYACTFIALARKSGSCGNCSWVTAEEMERLPLATAHRKAADLATP